jgi:hypothetical protein
MFVFAVGLMILFNEKTWLDHSSQVFVRWLRRRLTRPSLPATLFSIQAYRNG